MIYLLRHNVRQIAKIPLAHFKKKSMLPFPSSWFPLFAGEEVNKSAVVTVQEPHIHCRHARKAGKGRSEEWIILLMRTLRSVEEANARSMAARRGGGGGLCILSNPPLDPLNSSMVAC